VMARIPVCIPTVAVAQTELDERFICFQQSRFHLQF